MNNIIEVNNISKVYKLGQISSGTIKDDLSSWWNRMRGIEDDSMLVDEDSGRKNELHWALKDVSFNVKEGDVLGLIGKNGAGKSTLLKIISRVTSPTSGHIKMHGRIASLLEVGTGFHPDLTGRENIYQNGAILGMRRSEINNKLDEIIDFSGVAKFIDTPVKRYSSGMYVRLAFAVAAHLEPEILIVDEVLAVGDAEFQKKCLGKMKSIAAGQGRTVLFVSHNLTAIQTLCDSAILLSDGKMLSKGNTAEIISTYLNQNLVAVYSREWTHNEGPGNEQVRFRHIGVKPERAIMINKQVEIDFSFYCNFNGEVSISLHLFSIKGDLIFVTASPRQKVDLGTLHYTCIIPANFLNDETYSVSVMVVNNAKGVYFFEDAIQFEINDLPRESGWVGKWPGMLRPEFEWAVAKI